ncbi:MAG: META domain-containing protein [Flavobacteriaceae bacterium]
MKTLYTAATVLLFTVLQSCGSLKDKDNTQTFWVNSEKIPCDAGAGKAQCLGVYKGEDLANANWQLFYNTIDGFEFKKGVYQKIKVKVETLDPAQVPADASTLKYTLVKVLEQKEDKKPLTNGDWGLIRLNGNPLSRMVAQPTLTINLEKQQFSGNGGCNSYSGQILSMDQTNFNLSPVVSTRKACINKNVENEYNIAVGQIKTYAVTDSDLIFYDASGNELLAFLKSNTQAHSNLHDIWVATTINGSPINRMVEPPRLEINLTQMQVMGTDGCNSFSGKIETVGKNNITFGMLAKTQKACINNNVAHSFNQALAKVAAYNIENTSLTFLDSEGNKLLTFLKVD